ncbi:leucine-rich repeat protein, partial [Intestinibacter sp.]|uniref:leucine-rich repeat protein n=1 Tax=Intestinibacter sp. TaxID=1965304 RepID=UPI003F1479CE
LTYLNENFTALEKLDLSEANPSNMITFAAFKGNTTIKEVILHNNIVYMNASVFEGCTALEKCSLPTTLSKIPMSTFKGCTSLKEVEIPVNIQSIEPDAFNGCSSLTTIRSYAKVPPTIVDAFGKPAEDINPFEGSGVKTIIVPNGCADAYKAANIWKDFEIVEAEEVVLDVEVQKNDGLKEAIDKALKDANLLAVNVETVNVKCAEGVELSSDNVTLASIFTKAVKFDLSQANFVDGVLPDKMCSVIKSLKEVILPDSIKVIGKSAFSSDSNLVKVQMPDTVERMEQMAFYACPNLELSKLPDSLTYIGVNGFTNCAKIDIKSIPAGITTIEDYTFSGCKNITTMSLPKDITRIGAAAFNGSGLTEINLPSGLTSIESMSFQNTNLTTIAIPESVTTIGNQAFAYNGKLETVNLPKNLTTIGNSAFCNCSSLKLDTIPATVTSIGMQAFYGCSSMPEIIYVNATVPPTVKSNTFTSSGVKSIIVPAASVQAYKENAVWSKFNIGTKKINITFDANNGEEAVVLTTVDGASLDYAPETPAKEGYIFVGWYKDVNDISTAYENNSAYDDSTTYTAKYAHVQMLGAQGKLVVDGKSGIRFGTKIFNDGDKVVEKGTLIIPAAI